MNLSPRWNKLGFGVLGLALVMVVSFAVNAAGFSGVDLELNDGSAWLMDGSDAAGGRVNGAVREVEVRLRVAEQNDEFAIEQAPGAVLVHNKTAQTLTPIETSTFSLGTPLLLPAEAEVEVGPSSALITVPARGSAWLVAVNGRSIGTIDVEEPTYQSIGPILASMGRDGVAHIWEASNGDVVRLTADGVEPALPGNLDVQAVSTSGGNTLLLDRNRLTVLGEGRSNVPLDGTLDYTIQQSSFASDDVALVTSDGRVWRADPTNEAEPLVQAAAGVGADLLAPVVLGPCVFTVSPETARAVRQCGDDEAVTFEIDVRRGTPMRIMLVNDRVWIDVLDEQRAIYLPEEGDPETIETWGDAVFAGEPDEGQNANNGGGDLVEGDSGLESSLVGVGEVVGQTSTFGGGPNVPPEARPDDVNARAGRSRNIRVLQNDFDRNGDILLITDVEPIPPEQGIVVMSSDRRTIQYTPTGGFVGTVTFVYGISDGQGGAARATVTVTVIDDGVNSPPVPLDDVGTTRAGQEISLTVLQNDDDPDGDSLRLLSVEGDEGSVLVDDRLGIVTITPPTDARGELVYTYTVADDRLAEATATITLTVIPVDGPNQRPIPQPDLYIVNQGDPLTVSVLANDTDLEGDTLLVTDVEAIVGDIELQIPADTGEADFPTDTPGTFVFTYEIEDDNGPGETLGLLRVEVTDNKQNLPPVAEADEPPTLEPIDGGSTRVFNVLANDSDPNGDAIVVVSVSGVDDRLGLVESPDGNFIFQPSTDLAGQDVTFEYTITDGFEESTATVTVRVVSPPVIDNPPVAEDDSATVRAGQSVLVDVLANDRDPEKLPLEIAPGSITVPTLDGSPITVLQEGQRLRVVTPDTASGTIEFRYAAIDPSGQTDSAVVRIDVLPLEVPNQSPTATNIDLSTFESEPVIANVLANAEDPDGDPLSIADVSPALHGIVEIVQVEGQPNVVRYTPDAGYVGTDEFTYIVSDPKNAQAGAQVRIVVQAAPVLNSAPNAIDDSGFDVRVGRTISIPVLANDRDLDGDVLSIAKIGTPSLGIAEIVDGQISFTAPPELATREPASVSLQYWIGDGNAIVEGREEAYTAIVSITVLPPDPKPPEPVRDEYGPFKEGESVSLNVLANDSDPDGSRDALSIISIDGGPPGLSVAPDAKSLNLLVGDSPFSFTYTVQDSDQEIGSASVSVNVTPNRPPVAGLDTAEVRQKESVQLNVLDNDFDDDGDPIELLTISDFRGGFAEIIDVGKGTIRFTPDDGVNQGGFSYRISDGPGGHEVTGTAQVTVLPPANTPPTATAGVFSIPAGETQSFNLLQLTDDAETPNALDIVATGGNDQISIVSNADGTVSITSAIDGRGATATINYTVSDRGPGDSLSASSTLEVTVVETRRPRPQAVADGPFTTNQGDPIDLNNLVANDLPVDATLSIVSASPTGGGGTVTVNGNGQGVTVTPAADFFGTFGFTYVIGDETGQADRQNTSARIDVNVIGRPAAPSSVSGTASNGRVELTWPTPANNGAPITYELEINGGTPMDVGNVNAFTVQGLDNGQNYTFRVRAVNVAGPSDAWSPPSATLQPNALPDAPAPPVAIPGNTVIDLTWNTPNAEGSAVREYQVQQIGENALPPITTTSTQITGLTNNQLYQFRVRARTDAQENDGWGDWSNLSVSARPFGPPAAPDAPTGSVDIRSVTLNWNEPDNNGAGITGYIVRHMNVNETAPANTGTSLTWTDGLSNGDQPCFRVRAVNAAGPGDEGPPRCFDVPNVPSPPQSVSATSSPNSARVTWAAANPNGSDVITYIVTSNRGQEVTTSALSADFGNLTNGTSYSFEVRARNAVGQGGLSSPSNVVTPIDRPDAPSGAPVAEPGDANVRISWNGTPNTQGSPVTGYRFLNVNTGEARTEPAHIYRWLQLNNGTTYTFRVAVCNAVGCSDYGPPSNQATPESPISAPSQVAKPAVSGGYASLSVSWNPPASNGGENLGCYELEMETIGQGWADAGCIGGQSRTLPISDNHVDRRFRVRACNPTGGCGAWSENSNIVVAKARGTTIGMVDFWNGPTGDIWVGSSSGTYDIRCREGDRFDLGVTGWVKMSDMTSLALPVNGTVQCNQL